MNLQAIGGPRVVKFAVRALVIFAAWFVIYDLILLPDGRLDTWLSMHVASVSGVLLNLFGGEVSVTGRIIRMPGTAGVEIIDGCNGLAVIGLFAGFVIAYPGIPARRLWFIPAGIMVLYVANVLRVVALVWIQQRAPSYFDLAHTFGLQTIFYVVVFGLWVLWATVGGSTTNRDADGEPVGDAVPAPA